MIKRNPTPWIIMTAASFLLGAGGNYFLLNRHSDSVDRLAKLKKEVRDEQQVKKELMLVQERLTDSKSKLDHLEQGIPATDYVPTLLAELEGLGRAKGLKITGVRPKPADKKAEKKKEEPKEGADAEKEKKAKKPAPKSYEEWMIEVKGTGRYEAISNFVKALNAFPKIVGVFTLDIVPENTTRDDTAGERNLEMSMEIKAYVFPNERRADTAMADQPRSQGEVNG